MRRLRRGAAYAAVRHYGAVVCVAAAVFLIATAGCAAFGRRNRDADATAAAREFARQGAAAMQIGQWEEAESLLREGYEASPDDPEVRRQLAEALWHRGAANEAMSHISAAVRLDPEDATLAVRAGEMAFAAGARESALERAEVAIRLDPQLGSAWALRGRVFRQMNQPDRALADMQRALVFDPQNASVLFELAMMYRERGEPARCLTTLHHLHDSYPAGQVPQDTLMLEGLTLMDLKRPQQATEVLLAASQRGSASANLLFHLAEAQSAAGRTAEALVSAEKALAVDSSHQASRELMARLATLPVGASQRR